MKKKKTELSLEEDFGIKLSCSEPDQTAADRNVIHFNRNELNLEPELEAVQRFAQSACNYNALLNTWSVTLNDISILPDQLFAKTNGSYMINLKTASGHFGKMTDLKPLDNDIPKAANVAAVIWALASAVVQKHYLKRIDTKLEGIIKKLDSLAFFQRAEKESTVEGDLSIINEIVKDLPIIKKNDGQVNLAVDRLAIVMDHSVSNCKFFEKFLQKDLGTFSAKHKKKEHQGISDELKYHWQLYRTCVQLNIMAMILASLLTDDLSIESINNLENKINDQFFDYKEKYRLMEEKIDAYYENRPGIKIKRGTSKALNHPVITKIGLSVATGGLGAFSFLVPNTTCLNKSESITEKVDNKILQKRIEIMGNEENDALIKPFIDTVSEMKQLYCNPVQISCNEDEVYLLLVA